MLLFGATAVSLIWMSFSFRSHGDAAPARFSVQSNP
jgi:NNP family nitrate/nitrite transporter-like MFS transporter